VKKLNVELDPKFEKAWEYVNNKMYNIKSVEDVKFFLFEKPSMAVRWTAEEREFMLDAWYVIKTGTCSPENKMVHESEEEVEEVVKDSPEYTSKTKKKRKTKK